MSATPGSNVDSSNTKPGGKPTKTRRRQRLSCVECALKRQKCDRKIPCSSCISRGVGQLCRWEPIVVRPGSQKYVQGASAELGPSQSTIAALSSRIAVLEQTILRQNLLHGNPISSAGSAPADTPAASTGSASSLQPFACPAPGDAASHTFKTAPATAVNKEECPTLTCLQPNTGVDSDGCGLSHVDYDVQLAAIAMAHMSLAPQDEYIGGGTVLTALHKCLTKYSQLGDPVRYRFPFAPSADSTTVNTTAQQTGSRHPLSSKIQQLVAGLPGRAQTEALLDAYFAERNWEFCLPERWFRQSCEHMWRHLALRCPLGGSGGSGGGGCRCTRCTRELNPHWLALLFAVLALAPAPISAPERAGRASCPHFLRAMEARRLVEDVALAGRAYSQPSSVHGVALSCIGAALLAKYLADRGRVSDAWKLTGTALRNAQAVGLHRDPGWQKWEDMDRQEREIRLLSWWSLVVSDRFYSLILGRPMMTLTGTFDVKLRPDKDFADGSPNPFANYQDALIALFELVGETLERCISLQVPPYANFLDLDSKYKLWLSNLPPALDWRQPHRPATTPAQRALACQRHMLAAYYLGAHMNLHRPFLMHAPPVLPPPRALSASMTVIMNPSRERCIALAMALVRAMCDAHAEARTWSPPPASPTSPAATLFHYAYFAFDGAVALVGALSQTPPHPQTRECLALIERAMRMLRACVQDADAIGGGDGSSTTAGRAIGILQTLRRAGRWDERFRGQLPPEWEADGHAPPAALVSPSSSQEQQEQREGQEASSNQALWDSMFATAEGSSTQETASTAAAAAYAPSSTAPIPFLADDGPHASFPFPLTPSSSLPSVPPAQPDLSMPGLFTDVRPDAQSASLSGFGIDFDFAAPGSGSAANPFDLLQQRDEGGVDGVDWSMFAEMQSLPGSGLFGNV
ncbi:hypothetical protein BD413DRAFT_645466 [Trametes elegans]|nr:hypothetical protein BD413DRAFT_645466 [Trametes elegans]